MQHKTKSWNTQQERRRGRRRLRWEDCVKRDVRKAGEEEDWKKKTRDRGGWKILSYEAVKKLRVAPHPWQREQEQESPARDQWRYLSEDLEHYDDVLSTRVENLADDLVLWDHVILAARTRTCRVLLGADAHRGQRAVVAANRWRQLGRRRYVVRRTLGRKFLARFLRSDHLATSERHFAVTRRIG